MKGIRFGDIHSYDDLQLILTEKVIGTPEVKRIELDIPGRMACLTCRRFTAKSSMKTAN